MKVLGIVPARGGSRRIPRKNLRLLGGKPLVAWAVETGRAARGIHRLVVSSDDAEVLAVAASYEPRLALRRPKEISGDTAPAIDYVRHALRELEAAGEGPFDVVVILQPSSPLTLPQDVDATLEVLARHPEAGSAVSVMRLDHAIHPAKLKVLRGDRLHPYLEEERGRMAEHELPELFVRNCAVYATRRAVIDKGDIIAADCRAYVMPRERSVDVNEEIDLRFTEFLLANPPPASGRS